MFQKINDLSLAVAMIAFLTGSVHAEPKCLKDQKPFALAEDTVNWSMAASPGSECLQGLRWSYMQIYSVSILKPPAKGKVEIVGPGFRYFADSEARETDSFTLEVVGKNRRDLGKSTIEIAVTRPLGMMVSELPR